MSKFRNNIRISEQELVLLKAVNNYGPCSSEKIHAAFDSKFDYLFVLRTLHRLVEKGFLQRIIINQKQLYKTSRQYSYIQGFLNNSDL